MVKLNKGDWTKVTGGNHGAVFNGRKWEGFICIYCAKVEGLLKNRVQAASLGARRAMYRKLNEMENTCKGKELHNQYWQNPT